MRRRRLLLWTLAAAACLASGTPGARTFGTDDLLDRYLAGQFDGVVAQLDELETYDSVLTYLREHGRAWIDAKGPDAAPRRELAAATFALEAARVGQWHEWKIIRKQPRMCAGAPPPIPGAADEQDDSPQQQQQAPARPPGDDPCYTPPDVLRWQAPPLILEWGCEQLRTHETPPALERWWQLAALAVAQRSEDPQFLIGDVNIGRGPEWGEIVNTQDEIKHLEHVMQRFPKESRFQLAYGIAHDRDFPQDAMKVYRALERDPDVGGEAMMRLGALQVRRRSNVAQIAPPQLATPSAAAGLQALEKVEKLTRDPHVVYLAHYFTGQAHLVEGRLDAAERAFRRASLALPNTQSASIALAALVFNDGRRTEGQQLIRAMLDAGPRVRDPWRTYVHADDRFWPRLIGRLRAEVVR